jgi:lipid-binding SYLF domain-containing protein
VGEGAFIIGAAAGNEVVYEGGEAIGMADLKKIDVGFQIGGQAIIEVIFFENEEALAEFKTDEFTFSGEVTATAVKSGVTKSLNYSNNVLVVTMPEAGLMADVSVGGQRFKYTPMEEIEQ